MDAISYRLSKKYTDEEVTKIVNRETDTDAMSRQAAIDANGVDKVNLKQRLDDDYNELKTNTDTLNNEYSEIKKLSIYVGSTSPTDDSVFWLDESVE